MLPRDKIEQAKLRDDEIGHTELGRVLQADKLVTGDGCLCCATGISDSAMLSEAKLRQKGNQLLHSCVFPQLDGMLYSGDAWPGLRIFSD
jgi:fructose-1,6-bisphosphatase/sedoheptulose 1,7-bisphosphatase-like protein